MKKISLLFCLLSFCVVAIGFAVGKETETEHYYVSRETFRHTFTVAHVSDVHYPYCPSLTAIEEKIRAESPDLVFITGDLTDGRAEAEDINVVGDFLKRICLFSDCYLVLGNHEIGHPLLEKFRSVVAESGAVLLENQGVYIMPLGVNIVGVSDGYLPTAKQIPNPSAPVLLLAHRPEKIEKYTERIAPTAIFSGHAHGGLWRMGNLALYAPNQGFFPKYTSGMYTQASSVMFVSRGLGDGNADVRLFNRYHLPIVTFSSVTG